MKPAVARRGQIQNPPSILAILVAGIGDTVLGVPTLRALRAGFPDAHIALLGRYPPLELLESCPYVDELVALDVPRLRRAGWLPRGGAGAELARSVIPLPARRFAIAANLYMIGTRAGGLRMAALLAWTGARITAGRRSPFLLPRYRVTAEAAAHELESQINVARALGAPDSGTHLELWITRAHRESCDAFLRDRGIPAGTQIACLHPGSTKLEARYPLAGFVALADRLAAAGARLVVTGGPEERPLAEALAAAARARPVVAAGALGLGALGALFQRADLLVTNDSGPMHLAAAAGCPLVALFGPTDPMAFGPRGRPEISRILAASYSGPWDEAAWLAKLPPAQVAAEAEAILDRIAPHAARGAR